MNKKPISFIVLTLLIITVFGGWFILSNNNPQNTSSKTVESIPFTKEELASLVNLDALKLPIPDEGVDEIQLWVDIYTKGQNEPIVSKKFLTIGNDIEIRGDFIFSIGYDQLPLLKDNEIFLWWGYRNQANKLISVRQLVDLSEYLTIPSEKTMFPVKAELSQIEINTPTVLYQFYWGDRLIESNNDNLDQSINLYENVATINVILKDTR